MKYCAQCGAQLVDEAVVCPQCGCPVQPQRSIDPNASPKSRLIALLLCVFVGGLGIHRFYVGKIGTGVLWLLTCIEGIAGGIFNASFVAVVQTRIDAGVLGRVMSLYYSFGLLPSAIGLLGTGFLAEQVGLTTTFVIAGLVICTLGLTAFCIPSVMRLDRQSKSAEHQTQATDGK